MGTLEEAIAKATTNFNADKAEVAPGIQAMIEPSISGLADAATAIKTRAESSAKAIRDQAPSIGAIYDSLAKSLQVNQERDVTAKNKERTQAVGNMSTAAASQGFDPNTGFEAAQVKSTNQDYDAFVGKIAEQYGVQGTQLAAQHSKDLATLEVEATNALAAGDKETATILGQIAQLKQSETQLITDAAFKLFSAKNSAENQYWQNFYADQAHQLDVQRLHLEAERLQMEKANSARAAASANNYPFSDVTFATGLGGKPVSDTGNSAIQKYLQQQQQYQAYTAEQDKISKIKQTYMDKGYNTEGNTQGNVYAVKPGGIFGIGSERIKIY